MAEPTQGEASQEYDALVMMTLQGEYPEGVVSEDLEMIVMAGASIKGAYVALRLAQFKAPSEEVPQIGAASFIADKDIDGSPQL